MTEKALAKVAEKNQLPANRDVVALAIEKGADVATIEKMMELQERYEANEARKAYVVAMAAFKADPPKIVKDARVNYTSTKGTTDYKHATLANVTDKINTALSGHGLSAAWETNQDEKGIAVTCKITHIMGHSESTTLKAGADETGGKNKIQAVGSTVTYLQRYTLLSLTGLATAEVDDDGAGSEAVYINESQIVEIDELIREVDADYEKFIQFIGVEKLSQIKSKDFAKAKSGLEQKRKAGKK